MPTRKPYRFVLPAIVQAKLKRLRELQTDMDGELDDSVWYGDFTEEGALEDELAESFLPILDKLAKVGLLWVKITDENDSGFLKNYTVWNEVCAVEEYEGRIYLTADYGISEALKMWLAEGSPSTLQSRRKPQAVPTSPELETLGLKGGATKEEIQAANRKLAKRHHPDCGGDARKFKEIHEAYKKAMNG